METIKLKGIDELILVDEIIYLKGAKEYSFVYFKSGAVKRVTMHTARIHRLLSAFLRPHKRYLVNPIYINTWRHTDCYYQKELELKTGQRLPIARARLLPFIAQAGLRPWRSSRQFKLP